MVGSIVASLVRLFALPVLLLLFRWLTFMARLGLMASASRRSRRCYNSLVVSWHRVLQQGVLQLLQMLILLLVINNMLAVMYYGLLGVVDRLLSVVG